MGVPYRGVEQSESESGLTSSIGAAPSTYTFECCVPTAPGGPSPFLFSISPSSSSHSPKWASSEGPPPQTYPCTPSTHHK